jgi:hypothetical protein
MVPLTRLLERAMSMREVRELFGCPRFDLNCFLNRRVVPYDQLGSRHLVVEHEALSIDPKAVRGVSGHYSARSRAIRILAESAACVGSSPAGVRMQYQDHLFWFGFVRWRWRSILVPGAMGQRQEKEGEVREHPQISATIFNVRVLG